MAKSTDAQNPSMEQILQTIRGVISGEEGSSEQKADNDDILELTEMVAEDGSITSLQPEEESNKTPDVLANIDNALDDNGDKSSEASATTEVAQADTSAETSNTSSEETDEALLVAPEEEIEEVAEITKPIESAKPAAPTETATPIDTHQHEEQPKAKSSLISEATAQASTHALEAFVKSLPKHKIDSPSFQSGLTLEELVVAALKPEIGAWLDKNLPSLVTHIVEKEIKKLLPEAEN